MSDPTDGRTHYDGCWHDRRHHDCAVREIERLRRERDELRKDAERYREWRRAFRDGECGLYNALCDAGSEAEHDAAIDAALQERKS